MYSPNDFFFALTVHRHKQLLHAATSSGTLDVFLDAGHLGPVTSSDVMSQGQESR